MNLLEVRADLHIHTCLSPCSDTWRMTPRAIVDASLERGLDLIAICDHNSMRNVEAVQRAARGTGLGVIAGMEITSSEEVHILAIFEDLEAAMAMQSVIDENLPGENIPEIFGYQVLVDEMGEITGSEDSLLAGATTLTLEEVVDAIHTHGGLAVACHVDREAFGIISQLGWIPPELPLDALEISREISREEALRRIPQLEGWTLIRGSDAHQPEDVGSAYTRLLVAEATFEELSSAIRSEGSRRVIQED
jgi:hypothetical protein